MISFETAPEIGFIFLFGFVLVMSFLIVTVVRRVVGEQRWAKLMVHRRRRMALGMGILLLIMTINLIFAMNARSTNLTGRFGDHWLYCGDVAGSGMTRSVGFCPLPATASGRTLWWRSGKT